LYCVQKTETLF